MENIFLYPVFQHGASLVNIIVNIIYIIIVVIFIIIIITFIITIVIIITITMCYWWICKLCVAYVLQMFISSLKCYFRF